MPRLAALLLAPLIAVVAAAAEARCTGPSLLDTLSPEERGAFDAAVGAVPYGEGLVWEAVRGETRILLIGTIHIHDPRLDPLMDRLGPMVDAADIVLLEMTPAERDALEQAMVSNPDRVFAMTGPTLPERLPETLWQRVSEAASARQIPGFIAAKYEPWFLALSLAMAPCSMPDLMAGREGLDARIIDRAEAAGVPMQALEPWDTLFSLFEDLPPDSATLMLEYAIIPVEEHNALFVAMLDGYFAGRVAEVWQLSAVATARLAGDGPLPPEVEALTAEMEAALLDGRNRAWIAPILEAAETHDEIVVAVGAAHMPGDAGLLRLLEAEGFEVRRLD